MVSLLPTTTHIQLKAQNNDNYYHCYDDHWRNHYLSDPAQSAVCVIVVTATAAAQAPASGC